MKPCNYSNCNNNVFSSGYCKFHQWARTDGKAPKPLARAAVKKSFTPIKKSRTPIKKHSNNEIAKLIEKLDRLVSIYVRRKDADQEGVVKCFTCTSEKHWKYMQNGHFVPRGCMILRFDLRNTRPQCQGCNVLNYGRLYEYAENLNKEQEGLPQELLRLSRVTHSWRKPELQDLINTFKEKIAAL